MPIELLLLTGAALIAAGMLHAVEQWRRYRAWERCTGVVICHEAAGRRGLLPVVIVRRRGRDRRMPVSPSYAAWPRRLAVGARIPVLVDPADPERMVDGRPLLFWGRASTLLAVGALACATYFVAPPDEFAGASLAVTAPHARFGDPYRHAGATFTVTR
ncbi:MAG: DUF3592 domain-containing protein [Burkholderiaceae bacterium]